MTFAEGRPGNRNCWRDRRVGSTYSLLTAVVEIEGPLGTGRPRFEVVAQDDAGTHARDGRTVAEAGSRIPEPERLVADVATGQGQPQGHGTAGHDTEHLTIVTPGNEVQPGPQRGSATAR